MRVFVWYSEPVKKLIIGIDEAGRGPIAGPVSVGLVAYERGTEKLLRGALVGANDSKKLTPKKREALFEVMRALEKEGKLIKANSLVSSAVIDTEGIVPAIRKGIEQCFAKYQSHQGETLMRLESNVLVLLDGSLKAPERYKNQKTIIRGDATEFSIMLASIVAKVTRDRHMVKLAKKYPGYDFEVHKGYGTRAHYAAILKQGLSKEHRRSFLSNL